MAATRKHLLPGNLRGWMRYYGLSAVYRDWPELDTSLRRRLRMGYWVMWKRPRTRIRNLLPRNEGDWFRFLLGLSFI